MSIYFTDAQIPELASLKTAQRRVVRRGAFDMLRREHPFARWLVGFPGGVGAGLGWLLGIGLSHMISIDPLLLGISVAMVLCCIGSFFGVQRFTTRLRPYFRRFIEDHRDEISRAA
jgi:hypothetical protein